MISLLELDTHNFLVLLVLLISLGGVSGFMAGFLGVGGGIVLVPGLYYIFTLLGFQSDYLMHICVGTSLAIIAPTGISSTYAHYKKGAVDIDLVKRIGIGIFLGVIIGTIIASKVSSDSLKIVFASALFCMAILLFSNPGRYNLSSRVPDQPISGFVGVVIGMVSSLMGIGGASLSVPFMSLCKVPMHKAIGSAAAMGLIISFPSTLGFIIIGLGSDSLPNFSLGYVNVLAWLCIMPVSILMAPIGANAAHKLPVETLRKIFAVLLILISFKMWSGILLS